MLCSFLSLSLSLSLFVVFSVHPAVPQIRFYPILSVSIWEFWRAYVSKEAAKFRFSFVPSLDFRDSLHYFVEIGLECFELLIIHGLGLSDCFG